MAEGATTQLRLDVLPPETAREALSRCCGSTRWVEAMMSRRPFGSASALRDAARAVWDALDAADYLEAFSHHPEIGADPAALRARFAVAADLSSAEQSGVAGADDVTLRRLSDANRAYRARFGYIFIVCATGKSAAEMLALLRGRLSNDPATELRVAAGEQAKITELRLEKIAP
jgi:2-oxo-4-hydroxy-4-carboxy-5-ureidoimidazoline decarboxylase